MKNSQETSSNFKKYIHKYINSRIDITVKEKSAPEEQLPLCSELLHVSYDHFGLQDETRLGEQKEFSELTMNFFFDNDNVVYSAEFKDLEYLKGKHEAPDNPFLKEMVTEYDEAGLWSPIANIAKIYFEETKTMFDIVYKETEEGLPKEIDCIRIKANSMDIVSMLIIDSENEVRFIGNHTYYNKNIMKMFDFLLLLKINIYHI